MLRSLSALLFLALSPLASGQTIGTSSFVVGIGPSYHSNNPLEGIGIYQFLGKRNQVWNDRTYLTVGLGAGFHQNIGVTDVPNMNSVSIGIHANVDFDIIQFNAFQIFISAGPMVQMALLRELDSGGVPEESGDYVSDVAINGALGLRWYTGKRRVSYELRLFDVSMSPFPDRHFAQVNPLRFSILVHLD